MYKGEKEEKEKRVHEDNISPTLQTDQQKDIIRKENVCKMLTLIIIFHKYEHVV